MQAERAVAPEFDLERGDAKAASSNPAAALCASANLRGVFRDLFLESPAAFHRARLRRGPGADLAVLGARGEIGVGFRAR